MGGEVKFSGVVDEWGGAVLFFFSFATIAHFWAIVMGGEVKFSGVVDEWGGALLLIRHYRQFLGYRHGRRGEILRSSGRMGRCCFILSSNIV